MPNPNATAIAEAIEMMKLFGAILIAGEILILYFFLRSVRMFLQIRELPVPEWERDVSDEPIAQPKLYHQINDRIHNLGYDQLAILQVKYSILPKPFEIWVYRSQDFTTWVEVLFGFSKPALVQFSSFFSDDAMMATRYPIGGTITTSMYVSRFARHSIENAWNYHLQTLPEMQRKHGDPLKVESSNDVIRFGDLFREKYWRLEYQRTYCYNIWILLCCVLLLIFGGLGIALFLSGSLNVNAYYMVGFASFAIVVVLAVLGYRFNNPPNSIDNFVDL